MAMEAGTAACLAQAQIYGAVLAFGRCTVRLQHSHCAANERHAKIGGRQSSIGVGSGEMPCSAALDQQTRYLPWRGIALGKARGTGVLTVRTANNTLVLVSVAAFIVGAQTEVRCVDRHQWS